LQDKYGFIWIGTHDGLCKFDGYEFTVFRNDLTDTTSLTSNWITALYEDSSADLWISTMGGGLNKFDRDKEQFIHSSDNTYKKLWWKGTSAITMKQIAEYHYENEKVLWIGTFNGLHKFDPESGIFTHYPHTDKIEPDAHIQTVVVDKKGMVWIGSLGDGLHKFNPYTKQFTHYRHDPDDKNSLSHNNIHYLFIDHNDFLWVATNGGGLNRYDPVNKRFINFKHNPDDINSISSNNIQSIYEDRRGVLWIGTNNKGLNIFDPDTETFRRFEHDPNDPVSLANNTVWNIFEDRTGVMWIGTWGGVDKIVPRKNQFHDYKKIPENLNSLTDDYAEAIYISNRGNNEVLWIGTRKGLDIIDPLTDRITHFEHDSISGNIITALLEDRSGILWIGTYEHGLLKFDQQKGKLKRYTHDPENPNSISSNIIRSIYEDKQGMFWIGTYDGGLDMFYRQKEIFKQVSKQSVLHMIEDSSSVLWAASWPGLKKYDRQSGTFFRYLRNPEAAIFPAINKTNFLLESQNSKEKWFWTATYSGLYQFDRETGKFITYTVKNGLPSNVINAMLEDKQGNLWLSTNNGLSRFNPQNKTFINFDVSDGLLSNQFSPGACALSKQNEMFFCSSKGVNSFYPDNVVTNLHIPDIVITDFQLFNKSVVIRKNNENTDNSSFMLNKHVSLINEITLSYQQNVLSFKFAALDFNIPIKNQYAYKLEGVDPQWIYTNASRRFTTYSQLTPGEYTFRVKGSNNDGIWNEEGTSLKIIITPPWWKTNWAYTFYLFLFGFFVIGVWRFQTNRLKMKQQIEMQNFEADKLREVDKMKSRFFANISHEFRTPLTLIKGPVKQMLAGEFTENIKDQFRMILRNSDRLLELINQILDLSKLESGETKLKVTETDISQYLKGIVLSFSSLAERKKISLNFDHGNKTVFGYIDRDKTEKIVTNLLSNAFKFTPESGDICVEIKHLPVSPLDWEDSTNSPLKKGDKGGCLQITISNTGIGIPADRIDKIFDRFYQTEDIYKKDSEGSGIGLALTKELVEACRGEISVSSIPNKTITFVVNLPIAKKYCKEDEIVYESETGTGKPEAGKHLPIDDINIVVESELSVRAADSRIRSPLLLIVEDNPDVTKYISSFMKNDYRIISAENGKTGLIKSLVKYPDLIISDVMMPEMDGFELCQKIKTDKRISHIPVILLTAKADLDSKIEGLEFGADDYVSKPFDSKELQVRVKNLIEQRNMLREKFSKATEINPSEISVTSTDEQFIKRLLDVFENHITESDFSTDEFAREVGMSRSNLHRKLQALTNQPTHEFMRTLRLKRAAQLLKKSAGTVTEIAFAVGFNNHSYFSRIFRKQFGQTPTEFASKNKTK
jgi:signal transduction histidine kinase/ligand-binding sensor domain-containing protein/DNA-binding response OmpR family regulator